MLFFSPAEYFIGILNFPRIYVCASSQFLNYMFKSDSINWPDTVVLSTFNWKPENKIDFQL
jgi:hypothetical protein